MIVYTVIDKIEDKEKMLLGLRAVLDSVWNSFFSWKPNSTHTIYQRTRTIARDVILTGTISYK